jgi:tetratricopeptide (TPR) repeat protein
MRRPAPAWQRIELPGPQVLIPSMLTREESQYLIWVASQTDGWGEVVDLGPWLGSSSAALAEGLRRRRSRRLVRAFDLFEWEPTYMEQYLRRDLPRGADFRPIFHELTQAFAAFIEAEKLDLTRATWHGGPIELLFVDAAKSWELLNSILNVFGDALVPGKSRVILQDFRSPYTHWLPLVFDSRPDLWREIEAVDDGTTVTFTARKALRDSDELAADYSDASFPLPVARELLERRIASSAPAAARLYRQMLYRIACLHDDAALMLEIERSPPDAANGTSLAALSIAQQFSSDDRLREAWQAIERGDLARATERLAPEWMSSRADVWIARGRIEQLAGRHEAALRSFDRSLAIADPPDGHAHLFRAECRLQRGEYAACASDVLAHFANAPRNPPGIIRWGTQLLEVCWSRQRDEGAAAAGTHRLLQLVPDHADVELLAAVVARERGLGADARRHFDRALQLDPAHARASELRALLGAGA